MEKKNKIKVAYPYKTDSLQKSLSSNNQYGIYPIGKFNAWHGGYHVENDNLIKNIADGIIIAYRIPSKDFIEDIGKGEKNPKYSNGFVLIQHDYESEKGLKFRFYSLYHHLMSKEEYEIEANKPRIPDILSKFSYKVSATTGTTLKGLEVYKKETATKLDRTTTFFLMNGVTITYATENNNKITIVDTNGHTYTKIIAVFKKRRCKS